MTNEAKKEKILAAIAARGRCTAEIFWNEANELKAAGIIKMDFYYSVGGNRKPCWVAT